MRACILIFILFSIQTFGQTIKSLNPTLGHLIDLSLEGEAEYKKPEGVDLGYYDIIGFPLDSESSSSSELVSDGMTYSAKNAFDLSYGTAWIEGIAGPGIGEFLTLNLQSEHPPISKIVFVNGFVKSKTLWNDYSKAKTIEMIVNDKPFAILNLVHTRQEQEFNFDESYWSKFTGRPWTMKFKILDVYKGDKYDKTAITDIYVGGFVGK